ncbi:MAG TPA: DUF1592 domain-containing protein [Fimbriiglobus sp.]|nr:DUF1592 domain-containing protein [Fimbriiglobus sp.]
MPVFPSPGRFFRTAGVAVALGAVAATADRTGRAQPPGDGYATTVRPLVVKYCLGCHSTKAQKGGLDLERFAARGDLRKDLKPWPAVIEQVEAGEMPPKGKPRPTPGERAQLVAWVRGFLDAEAKARAGDPGEVPLRRLSNAEYNYSVRDLTGVDLRPAREFPADGAAGEGFTNAAEALTDISPALLSKYLNAAKDVADHAVLLPDGFRFSPSKTRRDWTNEGTAALRKFYAGLAPADGRPPVRPYLLATVRHRPALAAGTLTPADVAAKEKLNAKYLAALWQALAGTTPSDPLDSVRAKWRGATEKDVPALAAEVAAWQAALWKTVKVGNYIQASWNSPGGYVESLARQVPVDPPAADSVPLRLAVKPAPGQSEVVVYLAAKEAGAAGPVVWHRPRFEAAGKPPLLLRDYADYGPAFEVDYPSAFAGAAKYLAAVVELANDRTATPERVARKHALDAAFLKRWSEVLAVEPFAKGAEDIGRAVPVVPLTLLDGRTPANAAHPAINGWRKKGTDLPVLVANASDKAEEIPGRIPAKGVGVHPTPKEFVAVAWAAPAATTVRVTAKVVHAHPACGNGVAWWLEHRRAGRAAVVGEGAVDRGGEARPAAKTLRVEAGDRIILAVDAKAGDHVCDMTTVEFTLAEAGKPNRVWDLAADVATTVHDGNPHADRYGNKGVWSFVRGPTRPPGPGASSPIPPQSLLGQWRDAASDPKRKAEAAGLGKRVQALLAGKRPKEEKSPDRALYDALVSAGGPLFAGVDVAKLAKPRPNGATYGLPRERFAGDNLVAAVVEVRLPAALFVGREFAVDARLDGTAGDRLVRVRAATTPPGPDTRWDEPVLAARGGAAYKHLLAGRAEFRRVFPLYLCFPQVVPTDEVVTLKMFHREDEPLVRLFLDERQARRLDRMWTEHRFVSRQPVAEYDYLPQFMGFTTQDTPKAFQQFFIDRKPLFRAHAEEFLREVVAAVPKQLDALLAFAGRAYRRPLRAEEKAELLALYRTLRRTGAEHGEAFRGVLARVLVSPAFLFRIEQSPPGKRPGPIDDWELATRLSYFLWSSMPDEELRQLAAAGRLRDPEVLAAQARRMVKDRRARALAVEFGTQWVHVRGFAEFDEKNEKLFPTFTPELRAAIAEESVLFFLDLFQGDRPVTAILDADHTFLNETLAAHYGIPGVTGPRWRKVDGVRRYGRGGVLGLASVLAKQAGASRTSPTLRGNWVAETLLGEKLPKPPPGVPQLPEAEGTDRLTMRQLVERHASAPSCAACHVRIDPFGFALERYDAIGRLREKDRGGHAIDAKSKLRDGTEFDGIDGLRTYLLTAKKDVIVRLFCRRLLGYALGRAVALSDTVLLDEMMAELDRNGGKVSAAVQAIVRSPQFRSIRGRDHGE